MASYEDPGIRNYVVDLDRYPELRRALQTGETVFIADAATDPSLGQARWALAARKVKTITVIPISWRGSAIGAIFLRTFRDGPSFSAADLQFCQVVANLTAKALRNAHRFERLRQRKGEDEDAPPPGAGAGRADRLHAPAARGLPDRHCADASRGLAEAMSPELERLVGVAQAVLSQESTAR